MMVVSHGAAAILAVAVLASVTSAVPQRKAPAPGSAPEPGFTPQPETCEQPKVPGPCKASFPRWWYNKATGECEAFTYGGCQGNNNNFATQKDCENRCPADGSWDPCGCIGLNEKECVAKDPFCGYGQVCQPKGGEGDPECVSLSLADCDKTDKCEVSKNEMCYNIEDSPKRWKVCRAKCKAEKDGCDANKPCTTIATCLDTDFEAGNCDDEECFPKCLASVVKDAQQFESPDDVFRALPQDVRSSMSCLFSCMENGCNAEDYNPTRPSNCPQVRCALFCEHGYKVDPKTKCQTCRCEQPPTCRPSAKDCPCNKIFAAEERNMCALCQYTADAARCVKKRVVAPVFTSTVSAEDAKGIVTKEKDGSRVNLSSKPSNSRVLWKDIKNAAKAVSGKISLRGQGAAVAVDTNDAQQTQDSVDVAEGATLVVDKNVQFRPRHLQVGKTGVLIPKDGSDIKLGEKGGTLEGTVAVDGSVKFSRSASKEGEGALYFAGQDTEILVEGADASTGDVEFDTPTFATGGSETAIQVKARFKAALTLQPKSSTFISDDVSISGRLEAKKRCCKKCDDPDRPFACCCWEGNDCCAVTTEAPTTDGAYVGIPKSRKLDKDPKITVESGGEVAAEAQTTLNVGSRVALKCGAVVEANGKVNFLERIQVSDVTAKNAGKCKAKVVFKLNDKLGVNDAVAFNEDAVVKGDGVIELGDGSKDALMQVLDNKFEGAAKVEVAAKGQLSLSGKSRIAKVSVKRDGVASASNGAEIEEIDVDNGRLVALRGKAFQVTKRLEAKDATLDLQAHKYSCGIPLAITEAVNKKRCCKKSDDPQRPHACECWSGNPCCGASKGVTASDAIASNFENDVLNFNNAGGKCQCCTCGYIACATCKLNFRSCCAGAGENALTEVAEDAAACREESDPQLTVNEFQGSLSKVTVFADCAADDNEAKVIAKWEKGSPKFPDKARVVCTETIDDFDRRREEDADGCDVDITTGANQAEAASFTCPRLSVPSAASVPAQAIGTTLILAAVVGLLF